MWDQLDPAAVESPMSGGGGPLVPTQLNWCMQAELLVVSGPAIEEGPTITNEPQSLFFGPGTATDAAYPHVLSAM